MSDHAVSHVYDDVRALSAAVAEAIMDVVAGARRPALVGWPVGRTTDPVAAALAGHDLRDVTVVLMDDYVDDGAAPPRRIPLTHPCSCRARARQQLPLPDHRVWSPDPADPTAYDERIADAGGIDVFVVALGASDGHVALNPPGTGRRTRTRIVRVADSTRSDNLRTFGLDELADVPTRGVTVGLGTITAARRLFVVAHGADKRDVVARLHRAGAVDPSAPMTAVLGHGEVRHFYDHSAGGAS